MCFVIEEKKIGKKKKRKNSKLKDWEVISQYALSKSRNIYWLKAHGFKRRWCFNLLRDARDQIETEPSIELTKKEKKVSISFRSDLVFVLRFGIGFEIGFEVESCCSATK